MKPPGVIFVKVISLAGVITSRWVENEKLALRFIRSKEPDVREASLVLPGNRMRSYPEDYVERKVGNE